MATRTISNAGGNFSAGATWVEGVAPTSSDDIVATPTSGNLTIDGTSGTPSRGKSVDLTGYTGTLAWGATAYWVVGEVSSGAVDIKMVPGMGFNMPTGATLRFQPSAGGTINFTSAGKNFAGEVRIGSSTQLGKTVLQDSLTAGDLTHSCGELDTNGQTCTWGSYAGSNSNTRTLTLGASSVEITASGTAWDVSTSTNYTINSGTSTITFTASSGTVTFQPGGSGRTGAYNNIVFSNTGTASMGTVASSNNLCANLTRTGNAVKTDIFQFSSTGLAIITNTLTVTGNSAINRVFFTSTSGGVQRTIRAANWSLTNVDIGDIDARIGGSPAGATGTSLGDTGGNSGITFDTPVTQTWNSTGGGNWSDVTKWTSRVPLPQDNVVVAQAFAGSPTITFDMPRIGADIDFSGSTNTFAVTLGNSVTFYGSLTFAASANSGTGNNWQAAGRGTHTIDFKGRPTTTFTILTQANSYTLQGDFTPTSNTRVFTLQGGTLDLNGFNITTGLFAVSGSTLTRTLYMRTGTITVTGTGNVYNDTASGTTTIDAGTSTIAITDTSATAKTFAGNGRTYNNLQHTATGSAGLTITGSNTFNKLELRATTARTVTLPAGGTQTITGNPVFSGVPGQLLSIISSSAGSAATLTKSSGVVVADFLSVKDSTATGGASWYAGTNSTDVSGNTGWIFTGVVWPRRDAGTLRQSGTLRQTSALRQTETTRQT